MVIQPLNSVKNQRGQLAVEAVLLLALSIGIFMAVSATFREKQYFSSILSRPWQSVSSMIQNGVWNTNEMHPAHRSRWISVEGDLE